MKKITLALGAFISLFIISCEGPQGPPGFDGLDGLNGQDGQDGINILGTVLDIELNFTAEDNYTFLFEFPQTVEVFESDVVLVYVKWIEIEDTNGDPVDVWRLLPQTVLLNGGILQYNYDHTFLDVNIFLEADFDLGILDTEYTDNQLFRIAILPAEFDSGKMDTSNIDSVMQALGIEEKDIQKIPLN